MHMDLWAVERLSGRAWNRAKIGALLCFLVAGGLLVASLFTPPATVGSGDGRTVGTTASIR
jgi:hypothetical protein